MTLADLAARVKRHAPEAATGDIIDALNEAQEKLGRDLGIPRFYTKVTPATGVSGGIVTITDLVDLISVEWIESEHVRRAIRIVTLQEANRLFPGWLENGYTSSEGDPTAAVLTATGFRLIPTPAAGETFYAHYATTPLEMTGLGQEAFSLEADRNDGKYPKLSWALIYLASALLNPASGAMDLYGHEFSQFKSEFATGPVVARNRTWRRVRG